MVRLSHSAATKYEECPAKYRLHYIDRIRSFQIGSPLIFGGAYDEAINVLLECKLDEPTERSTDDIERLKQGFDYHFTYQMINKELLDVRTSHFIDYFGSDFDRNLLNIEDIGKLQDYIEQAGYIDDETNEVPEPMSLYDEIAENRKSGQTVDGTDYSFYCYCTWLSLRRKGHLMIEHYLDEIYPKIKRVASVQRKVSLPNGEGDEMIGYIDFEGELEGHEGVITIDNKTSSKPYKLSDINDKGQLLVYDEYTENGLGSYIVIMKKIKYVTTVKCGSCGFESTRRLKNCPEKPCKGKMAELSIVPTITSQILVDKIDEDKKAEHFEGLTHILESIKAEEFPQNRESQCFSFGRKCIYFDLCRSKPTDLDLTGLHKIK